MAVARPAVAAVEKVAVARAAVAVVGRVAAARAAETVAVAVDKAAAVTTGWADEAGDACVESACAGCGSALKPS